MSAWNRISYNTNEDGIVSELCLPKYRVGMTVTKETIP